MATDSNTLLYLSTRMSCLCCCEPLPRTRGVDGTAIYTVPICRHEHAEYSPVLAIL